MSDPAADYIITRILRELRRFAEDLENDPSIRDKPEVIKAIVDKYDTAKDALQQPWVARTAKYQEDRRYL